MINRLILKYGPLLGVLSAIITILTSIFTFAFNNTHLALVLFLSWFCLISIIVLSALFYTLNKMISTKYPHEFHARFLSFTYTQRQREKITYNSYRVIQCKRPYKAFYRYSFKWQAVTNPEITSSLQNAATPNFLNQRDQVDTVDLEFKQPLTYNDTDVVHFKADIDNHDNSNEPWISIALRMDVPVVHFLAELDYKSDDFNLPARIEKKSLNSRLLAGQWQYVTTVPFHNKRYEYFLLNGEVGTNYRMIWEK